MLKAEHDLILWGWPFWKRWRPELGGDYAHESFLRLSAVSGFAAWVALAAWGGACVATRSPGVGLPALGAGNPDGPGSASFL